MKQKLVLLLTYLVGGHLLLGLALFLAQACCGIHEGIGYYLHLLFGIPNLPTIYIIGSLGLFTASTSLNIILLMTAGLLQWILAAVVLVLLDNFLLWLRVWTDNCLIQHDQTHIKMLDQLNKHNTAGNTPAMQ